MEAAPTPAVKPSVLEQPSGSNPLTLRFWLGKIDLRAIALFRIVLGLFILFDAVEFAPDLRAWFSDAGVLPRAPFISGWARQTRFVLLDSFASPAMCWVYWAIAVIVSIAVILGYRTKLASFLAFVIFAGFQERIPPLFDGSDTVLRVLLFWHMFTSSGNVWSIDALRASKLGRPFSMEGFALPVRLVGLQVGWVYLCSAFYKAGGHSWRDGTAVHYTLHLTHVFSRSWAPIFDQPFLVHAMTYGTLVVESSFLILTHLPIADTWRKRGKALALLGGTSLHAGIFMTINVGHFSYFMPMTYLALFEPEWAQWVVDRATRVIKIQEWMPRFEKLAATLPETAFQTPAPGMKPWVRYGWMGVVAFFVLVCWGSLPKNPQFPMPTVLNQTLEYTSMWSNWDMFAPEPLSTDYQLSAPAVFEDGTTTDLLGPGGEKRGFFFTRWWKYMENVTGGNQTLPMEWGRYICREHNFDIPPGQPRLYSFTLIKDNQQIPPMGQPWPDVQRTTVWHHVCYDKPKDKAEPTLPVAVAPKHLP